MASSEYAPGTIVWYWGDLVCRFEPDAEMPSPMGQLTEWKRDMLIRSLSRVMSEAVTVRTRAERARPDA